MSLMRWAGRSGWVIVQHRIDTGSVRQTAHCTPLGFQEEKEEHLKAMLKSGVITPSTSEWASPGMSYSSKRRTVESDGVDYRKLNELTLKAG